MRSRLLVMLVAVGMLATPTAAQLRRVAGTIVNAENGDPVPLVILDGVGADGVTYANFLARQDGGFSVALATPIVRLRARRLGFTPVEADIPADAPMRIVMRALPQRLAVRRVSARTARDCRARDHTGDGGELAEVVGEQFLRSALALEAARDSVRLIEWRTKDRRGGQEVGDSSLVALDSVFVAYRPGRVVTGVGLISRIQLPSARDLGSDTFIDSRCFTVRGTVVEGTDTLDLLHFEPSRRLKDPDVRGDIAVDRRTALPRWMEVEVVNLIRPVHAYRRVRGSFQYRIIGPLLAVPVSASISWLEFGESSTETLERRFLLPRSLRDTTDTVLGAP
jgi:hypothetical protein